MKKVIFSLLFILPAFIILPNAQAINVSSASYFEGLYKEGGLRDISLVNDILFDSAPLGYAGDGLAMTVDLNDLTLSFLNNTFGKMILENNQKIAFDNGTIIFASNTVSGDGGAVINNSSVINFANSRVNFTSNSASGNGGAIYDTRAEVNFTSASVHFTSNSAKTGGAIANYSNSSMSFTDSVINFTGNIAMTTVISVFSAPNFTNGSVKVSFEGASNVGGAIYNDSNSTINFIDSKVNFTANIAVSSGGAIFNYTGAKVNFTSASANFAGNSAHSGGAIANYDSSNMNFTGSAINFTGNSANNLGGAIINNIEAEVNFTSVSVNFTGNSADIGGAIANCSGSATIASTTTFVDSQVNFTSNSAIDRGGGIFNSWSVINFANSQVNFTGNSAIDSGGAIINDVRAEVNFTSVSVNFIGNSASVSGAIANYDSSNMSFTDSAINFTGNSATLRGGAISGDRSTANFTNGSVNFTGNNAGNVGGAIYNGFNSTINFIDSEVNFTGNIAVSSGGAIYASSSSAITFKASSKDITLTFKDNMAGAISNDIYAESGSSINFDAKRNIIFDNGIKIAGAGKINKIGNGKLIFGKDSEVFSELFIIDEGALVLSDGVNLRAKDIRGIGAIDMQNESANIVETDRYEILNLKIDIFKDGRNDKVIADEAILGGNLDIKARLGKYDNREYDVVIGGTKKIFGIFSSTSSNNSGLTYTLIKDTENNIVKLIVNGIYSSDFWKLDGLTYNQSETARTFYSLPLDDNISDELNEFIMQYSDKNIKTVEEQREMLRKTSGYFLSNVIRNAAADSPNNEIYDKIRNHDEEEYVNSGIWAQVKSGRETFKGDENSIGDYKDVSLGAMFGFDKYVEEKSLMWGVYGRFSGENIEQEENKASGQKNGIGVYGGYLKEKYEIKAMLLGSYDIFNTERYVLGKTAKADISAITVSADIEGALKYKINDEIKFRPYTAIEAENTSYGGFKESGAGILDLEVSGGNYLRSAARLGAGIEYEKESFIVYAKAEGKYLFSGTAPEIESVFKDTKKKFNNRGAKEGALEIGIGAGIEVKITENWKGYANANYYGADRYENIYGNIGARYIFGKKIKSSEDDEDIIVKALGEKDILEVWETQGDSDGTVEVRKEIMESLSFNESDKIYKVCYEGRVFAFNDEINMKRFANELRKNGAKKKEIRISETKIIDEKINCSDYLKELGDMSEGMMIVKYARGITEIKEIPEEAKKVKRESILMKILEESEASIIIETRENRNTIVMRKEAGTRLGLKEGGKVCLVNYGNRIFVFKDEEGAESFIEKLNKAGAKVGKENIRELEGVYVNDGEVEINKEDIRELKDLSKGIIITEYKNDIKEIKSAAEEENRKQGEKITEKKLEQAQERREKPIIKSYRLNIANFRTNEYDLTKEAQETIKSQAKEIREYDYKKITIEGHTDSTGTDEINIKLSRNRAEVVYKEFLLNGIPVEKIGFIGFAATIPIDTNKTKEGRAANRRTEIFVE
ncbi:MAG: autotransporter domain-containing protein [Endomicrobium sp.]|jgi:predicted outer membrane repeat protein|nr:autotransporter domain-containing protein [Endomicrobium sp.]